MGQININGPDDHGDRVAAAGINLIAVIIIALVVLLIAYWFVTGPLHSFGAGGTNININPQINVPSQGNPGTNPGAAPQPKKPMTFDSPIYELEWTNWVG